MRDYYKEDETGFLPCVDLWKMSWIILIDNSGSIMVSEKQTTDIQK